ncbi:MAG: AAA family ATPase [Bacteroidia bacterium]
MDSDSINSLLSEIPSFYKNGRFIQPYQLFFHLNKSISSVKMYHNIDADLLFPNLEASGMLKNKNVIKSEIVREKDKNLLSSYLILFDKNLFLYCDNGADGGTLGIKLVYDSTSSVTEIKKIEKFVFEAEIVDSSNNVYLLTQEQFGLDVKNFPIKKTDFDIKENYNDDFAPIHDFILSKLKNTSKGIVLLHGAPGTGKTSYIRYLIGNISKRMLFIPTNYAHHIATAEFTSILSQSPNSIIIIEDAESVLGDRGDGVNGKAVSNLLNISDGILSDCLNIQIICSFNTDLKKIDPALLRKGRLIAKYEFKALETEKAKKLSQKLGFKTKINSATTLADIYNPNDMEVNNKTTEIGFSFKNKK